MSKLLNVQQVSEYLGIKVSTVYKWIHYGYIPYVKLGKLVRFNQAKVDAWIESRSVEGRKTRKVDIRELGI